MLSNNNQAISAEISREEIKRPLVLVVDDDPFTLKHIEKILKKDGLAYKGVSSAEEAITFLEDHAPDLILSDIMMPEMSGLEFCAYLKQQPNLDEIPIIFSTGLSNMDTLSQAYEAGANDYVVKPIRKVELLSRARHHIDSYRRKQDAKNRIHDLNRQNESKTKFLGVASHDLRNPLVSIRGISQYLEKEQYGPLNDNQHELVSTIVQASESMLTLVEDLLDVSLFESGQMRLDAESEPLEALVDQAVKLHSSSASKKQIRITKEILTDDTQADLDRRLVSRVIDNLVTNAIKFSPEETEIRIVLNSDDDHVYLKVEDEGPGIPEDEFNKLFKEFGRTSNLPTGGESSTGIGLFVCHRIVIRHGGTISAENRSTKGARFSVSFNRTIIDE